MWGRVQHENMTPLNRQLYTGDEKDSPFLSVGQKILIEGHLLMIGDGNDVETFIGRF
jgi:hypothetical protein